MLSFFRFGQTPKRRRRFLSKTLKTIRLRINADPLKSPHLQNHPGLSEEDILGGRTLLQCKCGRHPRSTVLSVTLTWVLTHIQTWGGKTISVRRTRVFARQLLVAHLLDAVRGARGCPQKVFHYSTICKTMPENAQNRVRSARSARGWPGWREEPAARASRAAHPIFCNCFPTKNKRPTLLLPKVVIRLKQRLQPPATCFVWLLFV